MARLFDELPEVLHDYQDMVYAAVTLVVQKAALAAGTYLGQETPVDTGVARSNWVMTLDAPFGGVIPAYVPYPSYRQNHHEAVKVATLRGAGRGVRKGGSFHPKAFKGATP